jgi:heterodisulfide reductase subunit A
MMDVGRHPRIELLVNSEVEDITGFVGNYRARVRRKALMVDPDECTACGDCTDVCPVVVPDEYQQGLSSRKAIYLPFPQAVPASFYLDADDCLGFNPIACGKCLEVCDKKCIDFDVEDKLFELEVGSVVVATGLEPYDPRPYDEYGYTRYENVITSMEFERLICAGGPSEGELVRPSDSRVPERVGFIQCVGSRSTTRGVPYCSNICCMNTIKQTLQIAEHYPENKQTVFYMDIRSFGKGFEDMYRRSREEGVDYVRGIPGSVKEDPETKELIVEVENTISGMKETHRLDMLVLSVGLVPHHVNAHARAQANGDQNGKRPLDEILSLSHTSDGFVMEAHPKLQPVDAPTRGVYFAGCVEAPKDVKDSVTQAGAAAARAGNLLGGGEVRIEAITAQLVPDLCAQCKICATVCPYNAIVQADKKANLFPDFIEAACAGCGTCGAECPFDAIVMRHFEDQQIMAQIDAILARDQMEKIVAFACNWCSYAGGDTAGTARLQYPPSIRLIRTMCSGRVDQRFIWHAFRQGAPMVLVSGCHFSDCHYIDAVTWTQRRVEKIWTQMEKLGIRPERLQLDWISAAEGQKFARVMRELDVLLKDVTEEEVAETVRILEEKKLDEPKGVVVPQPPPTAETADGLPVVT